MSFLLLTVILAELDACTLICNVVDVSNYCELHAECICGKPILDFLPNALLHGRSLHGASIARTTIKCPPLTLTLTLLRFTLS